MDKSPDAFRTISEVAEDLDMPQHVLRFWETRFTQIKPLKRGGGRRYYRPDDVDLLKGLRRLLYGEGYTIKGVQRILKEQGARHVVAIGRGAAIANPDAPEPAAVPERAHAQLSSPGMPEFAMPPVAASMQAPPVMAYAPLAPHRFQTQLAEPEADYIHAVQEQRVAVPLGSTDATNRLKAALFELGEARGELVRIGSAQMADANEG